MINTEKRLESGAVQLNDDWPGVFIRGDEAACLYSLLEDVALKDTVTAELHGWRVAQFKRWVEDAIGRKPGVFVASSKPLDESRIQKIEGQVVNKRP